MVSEFEGSNIAENKEKQQQDPFFFLTGWWNHYVCILQMNEWMWNGWWIPGVSLLQREVTDKQGEEARMIHVALY